MPTSPNTHITLQATTCLCISRRGINCPRTAIVCLVASHMPELVHPHFMPLVCSSSGLRREATHRHRLARRKGRAAPTETFAATDIFVVLGCEKDLAAATYLSKWRSIASTWRHLRFFLRVAGRLRQSHFLNMTVESSTQRRPRRNTRADTHARALFSSEERPPAPAHVTHT